MNKKNKCLAGIVSMALVATLVGGTIMGVSANQRKKSDVTGQSVSTIKEYESTGVSTYIGQGYDVIFMEEATQFTEFQFQSLTESNRSSGLCKTNFRPRMYFTCNPGGVGHGWVKRLFIDRDYREKEVPEDYTFIQRLVYENKYLMERDHDYVRECLSCL